MMSPKMSVRVAVALAVALAISAASLHLSSGGLEHVGLSSATVDLSTTARMQMNHHRTSYVERKVQGITIALFVFAGIVVISCIPCALLWWRLYRELNNGRVSWSNPSSLMPFGATSVVRPTSPVTYRAAVPSPVVIRAA